VLPNLRALARVVMGIVHALRIAALTAAFIAVPLAASAIPEVGKPAPPFSLAGIDAGRPVSLAALHGKPVYLVFFASWCGPCNIEAPTIGKLRAKYAKSGLQVVGVDELDAPGRGAAFQKQYNDPYTTVAIDDSGSVGRAYSATYFLPVHVFINRRGDVTFFKIGELSPQEIDANMATALK
jgi:thiol-disulfide isomerase/thioredoxin